MTTFRHGDRIRYETTGDDGFPLVRYGFVGGVTALKERGLADGETLFASDLNTDKQNIDTAFSTVEGLITDPAEVVYNNQFRDNDIIMIPKGRLLLTDEYIELLFTRGLYGVFPTELSVNFAKLSSI